MRVIVVGAGVIGASVAEALASRGAGVTVLEMRSPGRGASRASAGILAPYTEGQERTTLLGLGVRSLDLYDAFVAHAREYSGESIDYVRCGTLEVALTETEAEHLRAAHRWLKEIGVAAEWFDRQRVRVIEPALAEHAAGALLIGTHGFVQVTALIAALVESARRAGAVFDAPVEAVDVTSSRDIVTVRAGATTHEADHVVIAAGSWSGQVKVFPPSPYSLSSPYSVPLRPVRGQLLHLKWPDALRLSRIVWGQRCYVVPWTDGTVLVGATVEDAGFDESITAEGVQSLTSAVVDLLPGANRATLIEARAGLRPAAPDDLPVIGPIGACPNVTFATGHYRNGILLAPLTAAIVTDYILTGAKDPAFDITTPDRFAREIQGART